jgi:catechol 2,3-dioxygenase-like lactoylglutathione lyase family enzyme
MKSSIALAAVALLAGWALAAGAVRAQAPVPPLTDDVRPLRASGLGLTVSDIERSMKFYTEVLGFKVDAKVPAQGAPVVEYLLGMTGNTQADTLVVLRQGPVVPGATSFGRIVLVVPNGRKMAERIAAAGYPPAKIAEGANIVKDPDGSTIELYQRPAAPAR